MQVKGINVNKHTFKDIRGMLGQLGELLDHIGDEIHLKGERGDGGRGKREEEKEERKERGWELSHDEQSYLFVNAYIPSFSPAPFSLFSLILSTHGLDGDRALGAVRAQARNVGAGEGGGERVEDEGHDKTKCDEWQFVKVNAFRHRFMTSRIVSKFCRKCEVPSLPFLPSFSRFPHLPSHPRSLCRLSSSLVINPSVSIPRFLL